MTLSSSATRNSSLVNRCLPLLYSISLDMLSKSIYWEWAAVRKLEAMRFGPVQKCNRKILSGCVEYPIRHKALLLLT